MSRSRVRRLVSEHPRVELANLPTPLERLQRAGGHLGIDLWIKREDATGLALGGNKTRILEYTLGRALADGFELVIAVAYAQSNHVRQAAAAARRVGIPAHLVYCVDEHDPADLQGNHLLARLTGVSFQMVEVATLEEIASVASEVEDEFRRRGVKATVITGSNAFRAGPIAYVDATLEITDQFDRLGERYPDYVVLCSTASTQAGLVAGGILLDLQWEVLGVAPARFSDAIERISEMATRMVADFGDGPIARPLVIHNDDSFVGPRYGFVTDASREAVRFLVESEGIFLEPVYTGKAFAGLMHYVKSGLIKKQSRVLFVHTGGLPILFEKAEEIVKG